MATPPESIAERHARVLGTATSKVRTRMTRYNSRKFLRLRLRTPPFTRFSEATFLELMHEQPDDSGLQNRLGDQLVLAALHRFSRSCCVKLERGPVVRHGRHGRPGNSYSENDPRLMYDFTLSRQANISYSVMADALLHDLHTDCALSHGTWDLTETFFLRFLAAVRGLNTVPKCQVLSLIVPPSEILLLLSLWYRAGAWLLHHGPPRLACCARMALCTITVTQVQELLRPHRLQLPAAFLRLCERVPMQIEPVTAQEKHPGADDEVDELGFLAVEEDDPPTSRPNFDMEFSALLAEIGDPCWATAPEPQEATGSQQQAASLAAAPSMSPSSPLPACSAASPTSSTRWSATVTTPRSEPQMFESWELAMLGMAENPSLGDPDARVLDHAMPASSRPSSSPGTVSNSQQLLPPSMFELMTGWEPEPGLDLRSGKRPRAAASCIPPPCGAESPSQRMKHDLDDLAFLTDFSALLESPAPVPQISGLQPALLDAMLRDIDSNDGYHRFT